MRGPVRYLALVVAAALGAVGAVVVLPTSSANAEEPCDTVRRVVAEDRLVLDRAHTRGFTSAQSTWVARYREVLTKASQACPTAPTTTTVPPTTTTTAAPTTTTTVPPTTTTTAPPAFVTPPRSIDPTGASDVTVALEQWIASQPNGTTIEWREPTVYRVDGTVDLVNRTGIKLVGHGQLTVRQPNPGATNQRPAFRVAGGSGVELHRFTIDGGYTRPNFHDPAIQQNHGVALLGVLDGVVADMTITNVSGDGVYLGINGTTVNRNPSVRGTAITGTGRCGVAIVAAIGARVQSNSFDLTGYTAVDVEPNTPADHVVDAVISGNVFRRSSHPYNFSLVAPETSNATIRQIVFDRNQAVGRHFLIGVAPRVSTNRYTDIAVTNNVSDTQWVGADGAGAFQFDWVDRVTVTGNVQPVGPENVLAAFWQSTGLTVSGNTYAPGYREFVDNR